MKKIFSIFAIIGIIVIAVISILLVLDIISSEEVRDPLIKAMLVIGILTAASLVVWFISNKKEAPNQNIDKNDQKN